MAESTLSVTLDDLRTEVAVYLGYNPTFASNSAAQQNDITRAIKSGLRKFYYPVLSGGRSVEWPFMRTMGTIALTASDYDYDLPDSFGSIMGEFSYAAADSQSKKIKIVGESMIRKLQESNGGSSGAPVYAAIRCKTATVTTAGSRWEALFWPTPDASYTLTYAYHVQVDMIASSTHYPVGGMETAETLKAACVSAAEEQKNDGQTIWHERFTNLLEASLFRLKQKERDYFGYMGDRSDDNYWPRDPNENMPVTATYNGVEYS